MNADVIVIGGGVAGFSAATAVAEAGARVLLLEARPGLGGRATAFTDPETGERVDNGQHILMGCYVETLKLLARSEASDRVRWQAGLSLSMVDQRGHESVLKLPPMASPLHLLGGVLAWDALSWAERMSILRVGAALGPAKAGHYIGTEQMWRPALAGPSQETVREWLTRHGQAPRLCELFWEPLALAALNQSLDQAAASYFVTILAQMFGPDPTAAALVLPAVPLDELYAEPARAWLEARGHEVRVNAPVKVEVVGNRVTGVRVRHEHIAAPWVISTVPWHGFGAMFTAPGTRHDHRQCHSPGQPAHRDGESLVRSAGDARIADRPAREGVSVGVRSPRHCRRRQFPSLDDLERRGNDRRDEQRRTDRAGAV